MGSKRESVMLAYSADEKRLAQMPEAVIFQRKLNGERARIEWRSGKPVIFSSCGNEMPFFYKLKEELLSLPIREIQFDGEFYLHGMPREEIHSICSRRIKRHPDEDLLEFHIFDSITSELQQYERVRELNAIIFPRALPHIEFVQSIMSKKNLLLSYASQFIGEGYEGIILRHPFAYYTPRKCNFLLKYKPTEMDTYPIIGYYEEMDKEGFLKNRLGSVIVQDSDGHKFSVGTGNALNDETRAYWWQPQKRQLLTNSQCSAIVKHSEIKTVNGFPTCTSLVEIIIKEK